MPKRLSKVTESEQPAPDPMPSMGVAPAVLAQRNVRPKNWCPTTNIEFDPNSDPDNPKTITHKNVLRAARKIKDVIPKTPMWKTRYNERFKMDIYYKLENYNRTGSFCDRGAAYVMHTLTTEQRYRGIITASLGNWAKALAYHGKNNDVRVTVVLPIKTTLDIVDKCKRYRATVILYGNNLAEAKRHAFELIQEHQGLTYIDSHDYPAVIAANGTIGLEIMEELPTTNVIIAPVGGGGLIAGIVASMPPSNQGTVILGVQPDKTCCFFKALENEKVYETEIEDSIATSLAVTKAGYNAFHTAQPGIKKMILVDDDWIARAMLHLLEEENLVTEGAGAVSLSPVFAVPHILPELRFQNVVCIVSGGNINVMTIPRAIERGKVAEGRMIKFKMIFNSDDINEQLHAMSIISNVGCNLLRFHVENLIENKDPRLVHFKIVCETNSLEHACTLKRVMESLFPKKCHFVQDPFSPIPICVCFPKKKH